MALIERSGDHSHQVSVSPGRSHLVLEHDVTHEAPSAEAWPILGSADLSSGTGEPPSGDHEVFFTGAGGQLIPRTVPDAPRAPASVFGMPRFAPGDPTSELPVLALARAGPASFFPGLETTVLRI